MDSGYDYDVALALVGLLVLVIVKNILIRASAFYRGYKELKKHRDYIDFKFLQDLDYVWNNLEFCKAAVAVDIVFLPKINKRFLKDYGMVKYILSAPNALYIADKYIKRHIDPKLVKPILEPANKGDVIVDL